MTSGPRCSFIVPAFNVADYLESCLESISQQTFPDFEVIVVDDGSTDDTASVARACASRDRRITVISQDNMGLSGARNSGLGAARGEYVVFIDGDDWVEPNLLDEMLTAAVEARADVVIAGCHVDFHDRAGHVVRVSRQLPPRRLVDDVHPLDASDLTDQLVNLLGYAWNKLYRRALLEAEPHRFEVGLSLVEDVIFNRRVLAAASTTVLLPRAYVHYVQRPRETLGTALYPDYLNLRARAIEARVEVLRHWGLPSSAIEARSLLESRIALVSAVRLAASQPYLTRWERVQLLQGMLDQADEQLLTRAYQADARGYDRLLITLVQSSRLGAAVALSELSQRLRAITRRFGAIAR